jgi:hypothetical protein
MPEEAINQSDEYDGRDVIGPRCPWPFNYLSCLPPRAGGTGGGSP